MADGQERVAANDQRIGREHEDERMRPSGPLRELEERPAAKRQELEQAARDADDCQVPVSFDPRRVLEILAYTGKLENALHKIAAPKRPDGTWNLSRDSCREVACMALGLWKPYTSYESDPQEYL